MGVTTAESSSTFLFLVVFDAGFAGALCAASGFHETCILNSTLPAAGGILPKLKGKEPKDGCCFEAAALDGVFEAFGGILNHTRLLADLSLVATKVVGIFGGSGIGCEEIRVCCVGGSRLTLKD